MVSLWKATENGCPEKIERSTPSRTHTEAGTPRKRTQKACRQCHSHKTKCSGDLPICKRCQTGGFNCDYASTKRRFSSLAATGASASDEGNVEASTCSRQTPGSPSPDGGGRTATLTDLQLRSVSDEYATLSFRFFFPAVRPSAGGVGCLSGVKTRPDAD
jgi:hypothetical protein